MTFFMSGVVSQQHDLFFSLLSKRIHVRIPNPAMAESAILMVLLNSAVGRYL